MSDGIHDGNVTSLDDIIALIRSGQHVEARQKLDAVIEPRRDDDDDGDFVACESCNDQRVPIEDAVYGGEVYFCPKCHAEWRKEYEACKHDWRNGAPNEHGDPGRVCKNCNAWEPMEDPPLQRDDPRRVQEAEMREALDKELHTRGITVYQQEPAAAVYAAALAAMRTYAARERDRARREAMEEAKSRISDFRINTWLSSMERSGLSEAIRTIDALISPQAGKADVLERANREATVMSETKTAQGGGCYGRDFPDDPPPFLFPAADPPGRAVVRKRKVTAKTRDAIANALYDLEPFFMPVGQMQDGVELARKFSFDAAPAYRQARAYEQAEAAIRALERAHD